MNASWSVEQCEWLQALGYDLLVPASPAPAADASVTGSDHGRHALPAASGVEQAVEPLLRALLRAARTDEADEVRAIAGDIARLRADPAAKRAIWPHLRALRARRRR